MAKVPTATEIGLGQQRSRPANQQFQQISAPADAFGAAQGKALMQAGQNISQLGTAIDEAHQRIQNREDTISRATEFSKFFTEASNMYQGMETRGDLTKSETAAQFNQGLQALADKFVNEHSGSEDSRARLQLRIEEQRARFAAQASSRVQQAQRAAVDQQWGSDISQIAAKVTSGEMSLSDGMTRISGIADEYQGAYATDEMLQRIEAAQGVLIINATQRLADLGQVDQAEELINTNPEVFQTLDVVTLSKLVRGIEVQKIEKARLQQQENLRRQNILSAAGVESPEQLSPQTRMLYYTGQMGPAGPAEPKEIQLARAITMAEQKYGPDSAYAQNLKALAFGNKQGAQTEVQKLFNRRDTLVANGAQPDNQELRIVQSEIDKLDPTKVKEQKAREDFPQAQENLVNLKEETGFLMNKIDEALMLATNEPTIEGALKSAMDQDYSNLGTGNIGLISSFISGTSDAAKLEAALTPIRTNTVLKTMDKMRAQSSSGATGLGAMSEPERVMLRDSQGALDIRVPDQLVKTLLRMRQNLPSLLTRQEDAFKTGFSSVLGIQPEVTDPTATSATRPVVTQPDGRVRVDLRGLVETPAQPQQSVPAQEGQ